MPPQGPPGLGSGAPPGIPHEALVKQKQGQAVMIWAIGAFCIFCWELLLCLPKEYKQIWKRQMSLPSILYLVNRYFGLLQLCFVVTLVADVWSPEDCRHVFYFEPVGALISTVLSQMILGSRVYAIYSQNKLVGCSLALTLLAEVVIGGISVSTTSPPPVVAGPPGSKPPCGAVMGPFGWLIAFWTIPLFYDTLAFLLTAWKAYEFWKRDVNTPLFEVIWRDGLLYFFAIFSMNAANVIIFSTVPRALRAINLTPTLIFEIVLSCRMVLNLRDAHNRSLGAQPSSQQKWTSSSKNKASNTPGISSSENYENSFDHTAVGVKLQPIRKNQFDSSDVKVAAPWSEWSRT